MTCEIELQGISPSVVVTVTRVQGETVDSFNDIDRPDDIRVASEQIPAASGLLVIVLPPHCVSVLTIRPGQ